MILSRTFHCALKNARNWYHSTFLYDLLKLHVPALYHNVHWKKQIPATDGDCNFIFLFKMQMDKAALLADFACFWAEGPPIFVSSCHNTVADDSSFNIIF